MTTETCPESDLQKTSFARRLTKPIDSTWLGLYRIGFGVCLLWQIWKFFSADLIRTYYVEPTFHFRWLMFDFVRPWSESGMYLHFAMLGIAATCIAIGFHYRLASLVFCIGYTWVFLIDQCWYLNHYYLICLLSFIGLFLPADCRLSLDAWRLPGRRQRTVPAWTLGLLRLQVGIPYFYGGIAKLNPDWRAGEPMRTWMAAETDFPLIGQWFTEEWCVNAFVYGGLLLDLSIVPLLLWKRTRTAALLVGISFHLMNARLFEIGVFPWMMIWLTIVLFVPPQQLARITQGVVHNVEPLPDTTHRIQPLVAGLLCVYLTWQLLMPLRHFFYPTHTAFTREGHQFSWRMKLNNRTLKTKFRVSDGESGQHVPLELHPWITWHQELKLQSADQFIQLAKQMRVSLKEQGVQDPHIYATSTVALNTRDPLPYISESVELSSQERTLLPDDWFNGAPSLPAIETPRGAEP